MASSSARPIELTVGGEQRLPLTSAGSVGYEWTIAVEGDAVEAQLASDRAAGDPPGGSAELHLVLRGCRAGNATVHLTLIRGPAKPPRETLDVIVTVRG